MKRSLLVAVAGLVTALTLVGCGVPIERTDHPVSADELGFQPREEVTSTTSSVPPSVLSSTTTTILEAIYPLDVYWIDGVHLLPVRRTSTEATLASAIESLRAGPDQGETASGLRSAIASPAMIVSAEVRSGRATVVLDRSFLTLPGNEQVLAVAQIVYTVTVAPGIGQIDFQLDGRPLPVPRGDGQPSAGSVSRDDYVSMVPDRIEVASEDEATRRPGRAPLT